MANELKHKSVGSSLSRTEWEDVDTHVADGQTTNDILYFNGTTWVRAPFAEHLSALTELAATPANDDELYIRDVSEVAASESKRITTANLIDAKAVSAVEAAGLTLEAAKNIIIADDGVIQLGTLTGAPNIFGGVAGEPYEVWIQPKEGNNMGELGIMPKGTSNNSTISLWNDSDYENAGFFQIYVIGETAYLAPNKKGTGSAPNKLAIKFNPQPFTNLDEGLGTDTSWWSYVNAKTHNILKSLAAAHPVSGTVVDDMTAGENLVLGDAIYMKSDGKAWKSDADVTSTMPVMALAAESIDANASGKFLLQGFMYKSAWNWTIGGIIYASVTTGELTQTAPSGTGDQVQAVGVGITADIIHFNPSYELTEVT